MGNRGRTRGRIIDDRDTLFNEKEPYGAMFHCVYRSDAHRMASSKAKIILLDLIYQYRGNNNGRLVLCPNERDLNDHLTLIERTGLSEPSIYRAAAELEVRGLIVCTRRGNFSRRVSWYGITWSPMDKMDVDYAFAVSFQTPLHWWRNGSPQWHLDNLKAVSAMHRKAVETIRGSHTDNHDGLTVITQITANDQ
jgi:hypothetical protein